MNYYSLPLYWLEKYLKSVFEIIDKTNENKRGPLKPQPWKG
jgi:hypothetical protein